MFLVGVHRRVLLPAAECVVNEGYFLTYLLTYLLCGTKSFV